MFAHSLTYIGKVIFTLASKMGLRGEKVCLKKTQMKFHNVEVHGGGGDTMSEFWINIICVFIALFLTH